MIHCASCLGVGSFRNPHLASSLSASDRTSSESMRSRVPESFSMIPSATMLSQIWLEGNLVHHGAKAPQAYGSELDVLENPGCKPVGRLPLWAEL